jgi:hypothetical protein
MDCGHHGHDMTTMDSCSMSCCHTVERTAANVHIFLLTGVPVSSALVGLFATPVAPATAAISPLFAPQVPPPKPLVN